MLCGGVSHSERHLRRLSHGEVCAFVCTTSGVWAVTGRLSLAASVGVLEVAVKSIGYYLHECLWESVARHGVSNLPFVACFRAKDAWLTRESCTIQPEELV